MLLVERALFGPVHFSEDEEYLGFQFRFLSLLMLSGALSTLLFVWGGHSGANPMDARHLRMMEVFTTLTLGLWLALRGRKDWFRPVAWAYLLACLVEFSSALVHVATDELRVLWFFINVPGVYLLLGRRAGLAVSLLTGVGLAVGNAHLSRPYSPNAMATLLVGLAYMALLFHTYQARSISYFQRMRALNTRLKALAHHDGLTGLLNARAYTEAGARTLHAAQRRGAPCAVLFIDLDHFKQVNDRHGHAAGDQVLVAVARCLQEQLRRSDLCGRLGGEEFSALLPDTPLSAATRVAEQLRQAIAATPIDTAAGPLQVTASIGVAPAGPDTDLPRLLDQADQAMYRAKAAGRNRVSVLEPASGGPEAC